MILSIAIIIACITLWAFSTISVFANEIHNDSLTIETHGNENTSGFSGMAQTGFLFMNTKSQLVGDNKNKRIDDLSETAKSSDEFLPLLFFDMNYTLASGSSLYIGIPFEDKPRGTLGFNHLTRHGSILNLSVFQGLPATVWKDPYLTGIDRQKTDDTRYGGKLSYKRGRFDLSYEHEIVEIDHDDIAKRLPDLDRNGNIRQISTHYGINLGQDFMLEPGFTFSSTHMDGDANSYKGHKGGLRLMKMNPSYMVHLAFEAGAATYDKIHPVFLKTRKEKTYETMGMLTWISPLGFEPWSLTVGAGYEKTDANIPFYDQETMMTFMTVGYQFGGHEQKNEHNH